MIKLKTVNWYMLNDLLNPVGGSADMDEKIYQYRDFDSNDEAAVKTLISNEFKPYYDSASDAYKVSSKCTLSYFLTTNRINFGDLFDSCLIAFDHPADPRDFFLWIWQVLFPGENYQMKDFEKYIEVEDPKEPYNYWASQ